MNSSFLPSEIIDMTTFSEEWTKPQGIHTPRDTSVFDSHHPLWYLQDGSLLPYDLGDILQSPEPDTPPNCRQHLHLDAPTLLSGTPDLSYTPLSCASNDSLTTNCSFHPISEPNLSSYVPVWDTIRSDEALVECGTPPPNLDLFQDLNNRLILSDSNLLRIIPSEDNLFTIHSPKPVFAYKTLQFDLDRIQSPQMKRNHFLPDETTAYGRKRCRDDDGDSPAGAGESKRPRITSNTPEMPSLFPEPPYPTTLRRQSFAYEASYTDDPRTTEMLFDNMYSWDDAAWAGLSCY